MSKSFPRYKLQECFMFDEEEERKSLENTENSSTDQFRITEFRTDKPYRLALYVHPSTRRKIDLKNPAVLANLSRIRKNRNKENLTINKQAKKTKLSKDSNVGLFDEDPSSVCAPDKKREKGIRLLDNDNSAQDSSKRVLQQSILSYVNITRQSEKPVSEVDLSSLSKTKQKKVRKSYIKKCKEYTETENTVEPSSDQILKEIDMKKITKNKAKKPNKEEEEFEKWAENVNSAFDEIDKFELSVNYD